MHGLHDGKIEELCSLAKKPAHWIEEEQFHPGFE
jgi:hypothetical protein